MQGFFAALQRKMRQARDILKLCLSAIFRHRRSDMHLRCVKYGGRGLVWFVFVALRRIPCNLTVDYIQCNALIPYTHSAWFRLAAKRGAFGGSYIFFLCLWLNRIGKCKSVSFAVTRPRPLSPLTAGIFLKILYNKKTGTDRYSFSKK